MKAIRVTKHNLHFIKEELGLKFWQSSKQYREIKRIRKSAMRMEKTVYWIPPFQAQKAPFQKEYMLWEEFERTFTKYYWIGDTPWLDVTFA